MPRQAPTLAMCSVECGAKCCRAPLVLSVTETELPAMLALRPDIDMAEHGRTDTWIDLATGEQVARTVVTFADEPGQACPFLDQPTNRCTVYEARPESCRGFPDRPESWCLAWAEA